MDRRAFLRTSALAGLGLATRQAAAGAAPSNTAAPTAVARILSTHPAGLAANRIAAQVLREGGSALDAAQRGVMVAEDDPENSSVGFGGLPNADGVVELDAAIIDGSTLNAGAVAGLRDIRNPIAVARRVLERTPHVLLVGEGARRFALEQGFHAEDLLTPASRRAWEEWKRSQTQPAGNHDTIGMIVRTPDGRMASACSTSGLAWKLPGRVGDSPLVGHGLYCDERAGGACATGIGEEVIKVCGSYQVVEFLRQGVNPQEAVRRVIERILRRNPAMRREFVGFVALRADGAVGYGSTTPGFKAAVCVGEEHELRDAPVM
jgi:isoaspartyl peptidase/L-asparaginase-like protein (Ntn-hydrolase superfamily)